MTAVTPDFSPVHGTLVTLTGGGYTAQISEVGANLNRLLAPCGRDLVLPVGPGLREGYRGSVLAPWPNRIANGVYNFEGEQRLSVTEPELGNASHGLVAWVPWHLGEPVTVDDGQQLTCSLHLYPQPGYPFSLSLQLVYTLTREGLHVVLTAQNRGKTLAPYAAGFHPYLLADGQAETEGVIDRWSLELPATRYLETDHQMIPVAEHSVAGSSLDFCVKRPLAGVNLDHGFGGLIGTAVTLRGASGGTLLMMGEGTRWVQVYTDGTARRGVAVEPMSAPANAFVTGKDLELLNPGQWHTMSWSLAAL